MAITVGDAVMMITVNEGNFLTGMKRVNITMEEFQKRQEAAMKKVGIAMVAAGTGIIAALSLSVKAAAEEEEAMLRLGNTLKNVGVSYDAVKSSLDKTIMAMSKAAAISDDELYAGLNVLLNTTGDYEASLRLLPIALDLAAGASMDLATAAKMVGKVEEGNFAILARYGIIVKEGATQTEVLAQITARFGGSAEAMGKSASSGFKQIQLSMDELMETAGTVLLPALKVFGETVSGIIDSVRKWAEANPELTTGLVIFAAVLGVLLVGFGTYILMAPGILAAGTMMGVGFTAMLGPIGLVILAIAALIAIGVALAANWDKIVDFFTGSHREMTKVAKEELDKQLKDQKASNQNQLVEAEKVSTKSIENLRKRYGVLEGYTKQEEKTLMDLAKDASRAREKAIDSEMDALSIAHNEKMRMIDEEYNAKVDALDAETNAAIKALEDQIGALDDQDTANTRISEDMADNRKLQELKTAVSTAIFNSDRIKAQQAVADFEAEIAAKQLSRDREDKRATLQDQIALLQEQATNKKQTLQDEYDAAKIHEDNLYNLSKDTLDKEKTGLDEALQAELVRLELERQAFEDAEDTKLAKLQESLAAQELLLVAFHDRELARLSAGGESYLTAGGIRIPGGNVPEYDPWGNITGYKPMNFQGFEGQIPGIPGTPIAATVHAGEWMSQDRPTGGSVTNNFNIAELVVREEADVPKIARELERMQRSRVLQYGT